MALAVVGAIASIGMVFGTIGYYLGEREGRRVEKERSELSILHAERANRISDSIGESNA